MTTPPHLRLHAALDGYTLAFVGTDHHERVATFASLADAALALREAEMARQRLIAPTSRAEGTSPRPHLF